LELQSLVLGLLVAALAFSVKTGLGWAYLWLRRGRGKRLWPTLGVVSLYAVIFALTMVIVERVDLLAHFETLEPLWRNGQTLHWLVAVLLFLWGFLVLRSAPGEDSCCSAGPSNDDGTSFSSAGDVPSAADQVGSRGWLALVLPCPVCLSVIVMSLGCLALYFPGEARLGALLFFLGFLVLAFSAGFLLICGQLGGEGDLERVLGLAMILIGSYFLVAAVVLPQFAQIDRIYRLAAYSVDETAARATGGAYVLLFLVFFLALGFVLGVRRRRLARLQA
jgi:predicted transporter